MRPFHASLLRIGVAILVVTAVATLASRKPSDTADSSGLPPSIHEQTHA